MRYVDTLRRIGKKVPSTFVITIPLDDVNEKLPKLFLTHTLFFVLINRLKDIFKHHRIFFDLIDNVVIFGFFIRVFDSILRYLQIVFNLLMIEVGN